MSRHSYVFKTAGLKAERQESKDAAVGAKSAELTDEGAVDGIYPTASYLWPWRRELELGRSGSVRDQSRSPGGGDDFTAGAKEFFEFLGDDERSGWRHVSFWVM